MDWYAVCQAWATWPARQRIALARQAGQHLHTLWAGRDDLTRLAPANWTIASAGTEAAAWSPPDALRRVLPFRLSAAQAEETLALWLAASTPFASRREQLAFAQAFFRHEILDRHAFRHALGRIAQAAQRDARQLARHLYGRFIAEYRREGDLAGWSCTPPLDLAALRDQILQAEQNTGTTWLKRRPPTQVFLGNFEGLPVVIKRHDVVGRLDRLRYRIRTSRARRACAAGRMLLELGIPTPRPLAFLEVSSTRSYILTEWIPDAEPLRAWVRRQRREQPQALWGPLRRELLPFYLAPYQRGIYHDDTKALNILIRRKGSPGARLGWIDVEGVIPDPWLTRYRVLRNLVQLNGSLRSDIPESERLAFLYGVAWQFPWLHHPRMAARLRAWTRARLLREVHRQCGP